MSKAMPKAMPKSVQIARKLLAEMPVKERDDMQKILPGFAMSLDKSGETVKIELLQSHIEKGIEHIKSFSKTIKSKQNKKSFLDEYQKITGKQPKPPPQCLVHYRLEDTMSWAAKNGRLDIIKYCVAKGANISANNDSTLRWAANTGHLDIIKYCVNENANISANDDDAFCMAAYYGHYDVVKYFIEQGIDINKLYNSKKYKPIFKNMELWE